MLESPRRKFLAALPLILLALVIALVAAFTDVRAFFTRDGLNGFLERAGWWAPAAFVVLMAVAVVISPIPNVPISAVLGMAYGPIFGTAIAVVGAILGAMAAFWIARHFGNRAIRVLTGRSIRFCHGCSSRSLSIIVFVARLIPVVSFDVVSYGAGLSSMRFWSFVVWSLLGMIPWTWFYTSFGSAVLASPSLATLLGVFLALAVLALPAIVQRYNPFGLRKIMMEQDESESDRVDP